MQDEFVPRGGDAVAADRVLALIHDAFDVELDLPSFLATPTLSALSTAVRDRLPAHQSAIDRTSAPLGFSQEGMLWHEQFAPGSLNLAPLVRRYQGQLDVTALQRSLSDIVARHAPLRTTFILGGKRPVQRVASPRPLPLPLTDLGGIDPPSRTAAVGRVIAEAATLPFDLSAGPLFDPVLFRLGAADHVLVIRLHHLAFDDWSVDAFRRELSILYTAHLRGETPVLPPLPLDFPEFCRRERRRLAGPEGTRQLDYWRQELAGAPLTVQLPLEDPNRPKGSAHRAAGPLVHPLGPAAIRHLAALARTHRTTLFMALLATFAVTVHSFDGQEDLLLASVVANRSATELEPLIGCFTKKILLRLRLSGDPTFPELMVRVRDTVLGALAHQDLPFETVLQEVLGPPAASHGLVPDVSVMFQAETPRMAKLVLPGLTVGGYDIGTRARAPHFAARDDGTAHDPRPLWGAGLYRGTFLILSVLEDAGAVSMVARGAFHAEAMERVFVRFDEVLAAICADHSVKVHELAQARTGTRPGVISLRGFAVEPSRIEAVLARHPGIQQVSVVTESAEPGAQRLVAHVVPAGASARPTTADLRAFLWAELPGYAWPAEVVMMSGDDDAPHELTPDELTPDELTLTDAWSAILGGGQIRPEANYWHRFSFIDAVHESRLQGVAVTPDQVRRNRTIQTLAVDLASGRAVLPASG